MWRTGAVYDLTGNGRTALKASYSRYGLQVGIDRVTRVNPLSNSSQDCAWTDPNRDGRFQASELGACPGFASISTFYPDADGPNWPYSDEVTAGIEHQVMRDMRVGAMYYYRTNRDQLGVRNRAVPPSAYTPFTTTIPNGPNGADDGDGLQPQSGVQRAAEQHPRQRSVSRHQVPGRRVHGQQALLEQLADGGGAHLRQEHRRPQRRRHQQRSDGRRHWAGLPAAT